MKVLHLADLHIGKMIFEQSLLEDQKYILAEIIEKIKEIPDLEAVIIAGDVYDRSVPPSDAVTVLSEFLRTLVSELKLKVFIIAGNHDSKERLEFGRELLANEGLYICGDYTGELEEYTLEDQFGPLNFYLLPYIKPAEVRPYFDEDTKISSYQDAVKQVIKRAKIDPKERNIIVSHQFVTAGGEQPETSDSEVVYLGGTENVDVSVYDKFDYVALGHLHGPQRIGRDTARYAGTPLKYSFSEVHQKKSLTLLDFGKKGQLKIKQIPLKPLRDMRIIKGPIEELVKPENYRDTNQEDYIRAIITNEEPVYDAIGQIRKIYPNTLRLDIESTMQTSDSSRSLSNLDNIKKLDELTLFNDFYEYQHERKLDQNQQEIVRNVIKIVRKETK